MAHPGLVPVCRSVFGEVLGDRPHQLERTRDDVHVTAEDLVAVRRTPGCPTPEGVRDNITVALRYYDAWLRGQGAVALNGLMEDAATAEIARVQIWQWLKHKVVDRETVLGLLDEELPAFFTTEAYARHLVDRPAVRA